MLCIFVVKVYFKMNQDNNHRNILLLYTGGTIGMVENSETGALEAFDFAYLEENVPELKRFGYNINTIQFDPPLDSSAISVPDWVRMVDMIEEHYDWADGFVVLHGTDTMAYTASALSFMLKHLQKPVILTGSQLPIGKLRTDGKENLITAIEMAAARNTDGTPTIPEVAIFFDDYLMRGNRTTKISADLFNAFESFNYPHLAYAGIDIHYEQPYITSLPSQALQTHRKMDRNVAIVKLFPGITPEVLECQLNIPSLRAIVLETYGSGNAPNEPWFLDAVGAAVSRGLIIVNVTQCFTGYVDMNRYETGRLLSKLGVISGYDSTTECAIVKLMYLLGLGLSTEEVKTKMQKSLRGEISPNKNTQCTNRSPRQDLID